jgi:TM2 domain-containing membrane protein YozV
MDTLETQFLLETSMVRSPALAAIVGFFIPALAAFYTGRIGTGILYLIIDFLNLMFAITGRSRDVTERRSPYGFLL